MPTRDAVPINVPMVSNMSIMQNVMMSVMAVNQPICRNEAKLKRNSVVETISANGGTNDAVASDANGLTPSRKYSPAQYTHDAASIPSSTAA